MRHVLAHRLGLNAGHPKSSRINGEVWISFVCSGCGETMSMHRIDPRVWGG